MKYRLKYILASLGLVATTYLAAQSAPEPFYGPYEQAQPSQFVGEWTRSDGTYELNLTLEAGELEAAYFNPSPINVESVTLDETEAEAEAENEGETNLHLTIVLRDQGYPGSTYELEYLPQYRVLVGTYTIPGQGPAEVYFMQSE